MSVGFQDQQSQNLQKILVKFLVCTNFYKILNTLRIISDPFQSVLLNLSERYRKRITITSFMDPTARQRGVWFRQKPGLPIIYRQTNLTNLTFCLSVRCNQRTSIPSEYIHKNYIKIPMKFWLVTFMYVFGFPPVSLDCTLHAGRVSNTE